MSAGAIALSSGLSRRRAAAITGRRHHTEGAPGSTASPAAAAAEVSTASPAAVAAEVVGLLDIITPPPSGGPVRPTATAATPPTPLAEDVEHRFETLARQNERLLSELAALRLIPSQPEEQELLPSERVEAGTDDPPPQPARVDLLPDAPDDLGPGGAPELQAEVQANLQLSDVVPELQQVGKEDSDRARIVALRKSPAGFGFRVSDDLMVETLTDATGPAALVDPPFPLGWYVRQCDGVPVHSKADLTAHLDNDHEEVSFTLEPPSTPTISTKPAVPPEISDDADEETEARASALRNFISGICTSCIWMAVSTMWDVLPWLIPFGVFMRSLSLRVESGVQMIILLVFLATPIVSMRYHGNSESQRHSLGDGWNIMFVGLGTLLTISFVQVFLFVLYEDIDSFFDLQLDGNSSVTRRQNATLSDPLQFGMAIFKAEFLPEEFNEILDEYAFGKIFLAAPPAILLALVLSLNGFSRLSSTKIANDSLSSELYSCAYFLWFYSLWLLLLQAKSQPDYYANYSVETMKSKVNSVDSIETVSYLTNCGAFIFMSFSIAVQEATGPTRSTDMTKSMEGKYFSSNLGYEGMFWLLCMWINGTISIVTTFAWTYQRQSATVFPFFAGLLVSLLYVCAYWYHVVWWYSHLHNRHRQVTDTLSASQPGSVAAKISWWRRLMDVFAPESHAFYTKQSFVEVVDVISQSYRSWVILEIAASGRFGLAQWHWVPVIAFAGLVCFHGASCLVLMVDMRRHSPYATLKLDLTFDMLYIVGGVVVSVFLWSFPQRGMPLCAALSSDWLHVIVTVAPLTFSLWSLPTVIARSAIFMNNKRPAQATLRRIFESIDSDGNGSLEAEEIGKLCENMGAKLTAHELELAMRVIDKDGSGEVSFDEFSAWVMSASTGKVAKALSKFRASGLRKNAVPPRPAGRQKRFYVACIALSVCWAIVVFCSAFIVDVEAKFFASMDQEETSTTLATFESTFAGYSAAGIGADRTASFLVLDKYTALRFDDIDIPAKSTVVYASLSFVPYLPAAKIGTEYCTDTNDLGNEVHGIAIARIETSSNSIQVAAASDLRNVVAGQKLRLVDAAGRECSAAPKGASLIVASTDGAVIRFSTAITATDASAGTQCKLKRAVCTSSTQIDQGRLRVRSLTTKVDTTTAVTAKPAEDDTQSRSVTKNFEGGQNFVISGIEATIAEAVAAPDWEQGNVLQLFLELLSPHDGTVAQRRSAACVEAEPPSSSCFFPKQLLAADCDSPLLTVLYRKPGDAGTTELTATAWPSAPAISPLGLLDS